MKIFTLNSWGFNADASRTKFINNDEKYNLFSILCIIQRCKVCPLNFVSTTQKSINTSKFSVAYKFSGRDRCHSDKTNPLSRTSVAGTSSFNNNNIYIDLLTSVRCNLSQKQIESRSDRDREVKTFRWWLQNCLYVSLPSKCFARRKIWHLLTRGAPT